MEKKTIKPRLTPKNIDDMSRDCKDILKKIPGDALKGKYAPVNVLGTLMYNPDTLKEFLDYWVTSKLKMGFSIREQELVILRMAAHYKCNYVWKHHVPVAVEFGVSETELNAVKSFPIPSVFPVREDAILNLTDELVNNRDISDETWNKYKGQLKDSEYIDLISLVSQYVLFALTNNVMRVDIEQSLKEIPFL
jgi:alkylhydroperoxidase family enzyme